MYTRWMSAAVLSALLSVTVCAAQEHHHPTAAAKPKSGKSMPFVRLTDDGALHMAYVDVQDGAKSVRYRRMYGDSPVEQTVSAVGAPLSHWPESPPLVEVMKDGAIHVLYSVQSAEAPPNGSAPVEYRLATSTDYGNTWAPYRVIGDQNVRVYRSCASMREDAQGRLVLSWLEGNTTNAAVALKTAVLSGKEISYAVANEKVCECCSTELTLASDGAMWLAYRGVDVNNVRDMFLARMMPGTTQFGPPARISRDRWALPGCPDSGPRFALAGEDEVWISWYSGNPRGAYATHATATAPQFAPRELVQAMDEQYTGLAHPTVGMLPDGRMLMAYQCTKDDYQHIEGRIRAGEAWGDAIELGGSGEYPRIAANGQKAYLVYTAIDDGVKSISVKDLAEIIPAAQ